VKESIDHARVVRALGAIALVGVAVFAITCTVAQLLRPDYSWLGIPLSFYVIGPYGGAVEASYFALALGLAALGVGWYFALERGARSAAPLLLFAVSAVALCITAVEITDVPGRPQTLHGLIHVIAAIATFVCVTVAMLLQSWRMRIDPRWHAKFRSAFVLAAIAFVALWSYAFIRHIPRGIGEKTTIALILLWLGRAAWWLVREPAGDS
jgi:hypothetical protein